MIAEFSGGLMGKYLSGCGSGQDFARTGEGIFVWPPHRFELFWTGNFCLTPSQIQAFLDGKTVQDVGGGQTKVPYGQKVFWIIDESKIFRQSKLNLKIKVLYFSLIPKCTFIFTNRMIMIRCKLETLDPGKSLTYLWHHNLTVSIENVWKTLEANKKND